MPQYTTFRVLCLRSSVRLARRTAARAAHRIAPEEQHARQHAHEAAGDGHEPEAALQHAGRVHRRGHLVQAHQDELRDGHVQQQLIEQGRAPTVVGRQVVSARSHGRGDPRRGGVNGLFRFLSRPIPPYRPQRHLARVDNGSRCGGGAASTRAARRSRINAPVQIRLARRTPRTRAVRCAPAPAVAPTTLSPARHAAPPTPPAAARLPLPRPARS